MSPETKKKLLYGGGALASIAALVLYMRNKQQSTMPISRAGTGASGGPSSGTGANNSAALNAAVALAVEEARQKSAYDVAALQANTALDIARLQAGTAQQAASERTKQTAFGPGGAATAAAPAAAKGIFDVIKEAFAKAFGTTGGTSGFNPASTNPASWFDPNAGTFVGFNPSGEQGNFPSIGYNYGDESNASNYVALYDDNKVPYFLAADPGGLENFDFTGYYQGTTGSGDALYFGDSVFNYDAGSGDTYSTFE